MLWELETNYLEVVLIPASEQRHSGHCIRAVQNANCGWYKDFCSLFPSGRKGRKIRTRIKRRETVRALKKIIAGKTEGVYVERLLRLIESLNQEKQKNRRARVVPEKVDRLDWILF